MTLNDKKVLIDRRLRLFASTLGWPDLKRCLLKLDDGKQAVWHESGQIGAGRSLGLAIQACPKDQETWYAACVYALRFRMCSGWYKFKLGRTNKEIIHEAKRLEPQLARDWFASPENRVEYRKMFPECGGLTNERYEDVNSIEHRTLLECFRPRKP